MIDEQKEGVSDLPGFFRVVESKRLYDPYPGVIRGLRWGSQTTVPDDFLFTSFLLKCIAPQDGLGKPLSISTGLDVFCRAWLWQRADYIIRVRRHHDFDHRSSSCVRMPCWRRICSSGLFSILSPGCDTQEYTMGRRHERSILSHVGNTVQRG